MLPKIKNVNNESTHKIYPEFNFIMNFDGCSKGNPGKAGAGAVIYNDDIEIWSESFFVGENATNNHAEYACLILGMQQAVELGIKRLLVIGDSQLVINHMKGIYKCSSPNLIELYNRAKELEKNFDEIFFEDVLRNSNKRADELANEGIKKNTI